MRPQTSGYTNLLNVAKTFTYWLRPYFQIHKANNAPPSVTVQFPLMGWIGARQCLFEGDYQN